MNQAPRGPNDRRGRALPPPLWQRQEQELKASVERHHIKGKEDEEKQEKPRNKSPAREAAIAAVASGAGAAAQVKNTRDPCCEFLK